MANTHLSGLRLTDTSWEDFRFPATAINPPGQVTDPDWDNTNGGWLFDAGGTEQLWIIGQLPHAWKEGTTLKPHVHWEKSVSAADKVLWQLDYMWSEIGGVRAAEITLQQDTAVNPSDIADTHQISVFPDIDATGKGISDILVMKLSRIGGDAADTYGSDARMLEFDIHYEVDALGSEDEFVKQAT